MPDSVDLNELSEALLSAALVIARATQEVVGGQVSGWPSASQSAAEAAQTFIAASHAVQRM